MTQDTKVVLKKPTKNGPPKSKLQLKFHIYRRLTLKHNSNYKTCTNKTLDALIFNKNTHLSVAFKDEIMFEFQDEFLKRYYMVNSFIDIIKLANPKNAYLKSQTTIKTI